MASLCCARGGYSVVTIQRKVSYEVGVMVVYTVDDGGTRVVQVK